ncbi:RHS repeat domain-containing protein, partial [Acinetobacter baumannii]
TFDAWGRVLSETDALGQTTNYSYDDSTRTLTVTTPDGVSISTTRNRHGEVITATDGKGQSTTYTYNKDGQLLTVKN